MQALADGHEKHTRMVVESGGAEVVAHVLRAAGRDAEIAEYCMAAIATLSLDSEGSRLLGEAGAVEGVWRTMSAHLETAKPEVQAYGCASLLRMTNNHDNVRRLVRLLLPPPPLPTHAHKTRPVPFYSLARWTDDSFATSAKRGLASLFGQPPPSVLASEWPERGSLCLLWPLAE